VKLLQNFFLSLFANQNKSLLQQFIRTTPLMKSTIRIETNLKSSIYIPPQHPRSNKHIQTPQKSFKDFDYTHAQSITSNKSSQIAQSFTFDKSPKAVQSITLDRPLQQSIVVDGYGDDPKDFQIEIERRYQRASLGKSYNFPRRAHHRDENMSSSIVSDTTNSSCNSLRQVTFYNLHAQNHKHDHLIDGNLTPDKITDDTSNAKLSSNRAKSITIDKRTTLQNENYQVTPEETTMGEHNLSQTTITNKSANSSLKLAQLIGVKLGKAGFSPKVQELPSSTKNKQQSSKLWNDSPNKYINVKQKIYSINLHKPVKTPLGAFEAKSYKDLLNRSSKDNSEERSVHRLGKSDNALKTSWEHNNSHNNTKKSIELSDSRKSFNSSSQKDINTAKNPTKNLKKIITNSNACSNIGLLSSWSNNGTPICYQRPIVDFKLLKTISPKTNTSVSNIDTSLRGALSKDDSMRKTSGNIGNLYEKTKRMVLGEHSKVMHIANIGGGNRLIGANINLLDNNTPVERSFKPANIKRPAAAFSKSPTTTNFKPLKDNYISPKKYFISRDELKPTDITQALQSSNSKSRLGYHPEAPMASPQNSMNKTSLSNLHHTVTLQKAFIKETNATSKERRSYKESQPKFTKSVLHPGPTSITDSKAKRAYNKPQQYSLFLGDSITKQFKDKTVMSSSSTPKTNILKNLLLNRIKK